MSKGHPCGYTAVNVDSKSQCTHKKLHAPAFHIAIAFRCPKNAVAQSTAVVDLCWCMAFAGIFTKVGV